jgi:hypothetical protein
VSLRYRTHRRRRKMYKIESLDKWGNWVDDNIGNPNEFETEQAAIDQIPELARIFECDESKFRVTEK